MQSHTITSTEARAMADHSQLNRSAEPTRLTAGTVGRCLSTRAGQQTMRAFHNRARLLLMVEGCLSRL